MAQTEDTYTQSDTTTVLRSFTFPYINQSDIKVELDGVATTAYSHPNLTQIQLNSAPAVGTVIRIFRQTSDEETQATFYSGSAIRARDLNNNFTQNLYVTQEANNNVASAWKTGDPTIISTETWAGNDTKIATTGAIDGRVDAKIDTALTTDVSGGDGVTIVDNNPGTGQIRVDLDADIATLRNMQSGAATKLAALTSTELDILDGATLSTAELNTLDGITATVTELNHTDGVTSAIQTQLNTLTNNKQPLDSELTELATMSAGTASALADLTQTEVQKIDGLTASTAELNKLDGATASTTELNHVTGVTSAIQTQFTGKQALATDLTNLSSCQTGASSAIAALTQAEVQTLDGVTASTAELNILDGVTASTAELNKTDGLLATPVELNALDGITSNTSELNKLDGYTGSTTNLNIVSGKSFKNSSAGTLDTTSDTEIPSSKVIAAHVASSQTAIGGFVTIADEVSFPNTQPANGVVVSINNAAGLVVSGSGASTSAKRVDNTTVTINGFPSSLNGETLAAGVGLVVTSTSTSNTYNYHKLLLSETDIKNISDEINDFTARYRIASSAPTSNNDAGDMYFDTSANKMKVYNGTTSSWDDVASVGNFYINTISSSSGTGGGSATFNNNAYRFQLSNAPVMAQQLIVSVNGVIQKPNAGTSQPSEGFAISSNDIIFAAAPPSGSDYFIVTQGSSVSIGTPSDNTVTSAKIVDGSIVDGDISSTANIAGSKLNDDSITEVKLDVHNAPATGKFLRYTSNGMEWDDVPAGVGGANGADFNDNVKLRFGSSTDLTIYHDGSNSIIHDNGTGGLNLLSNAFKVMNAANNEAQIYANENGAVELYYDNSKKFETTSGGVAIDGDLKLANSSIDNALNWGKTASILQARDSTKLTFGNANDLQIYHNGSHSYIDNTNGTGNIYIKDEVVRVRASTSFAVDNADGSETALMARLNGSVDLYHDNAKKLETTSSGINVTGQINVNGSALSAAPEITGTASGSIAQDKPCIVKTDGNLEQVVKSITQQNPALADTNDFVAQGEYLQNGSKLIWIEEKSCFIVMYHTIDASNNRKAKAKVGILGTGSDAKKILWGPEAYLATENWSSIPILGYDPDSDHLVGLLPYGNGSHSRIRSYTLAIDLNNAANCQINYANQMTWQQYQNYIPIDVVYDYTAEKLVTILVSNSNGSTECRVMEVDSSNGAMSWPSGSSAVGMDPDGHEARIQVKVKYIADIGKIAFAYIAGGSGSESLKFNTMNVNSNNSITFNTSVMLTDGINNSSNGQPDNCIDHSWDYDKSIDRFVITYMIHDGSDKGKTSIQIGTYNSSNGNVTWTNRNSILSYSSGSYTSSNQQTIYDENAGRMVFLYIDPRNSNKTKAFTWTANTNGTGSNIGTPTLLVNANQTVADMIYRSSIKAAVMIDRQNSNNTAGYSHSITSAVATTNMTTENFVGFAKAAATNGNSVDIKVVGNTSTQSSLTTGQKYYIQMDGTLGTSADNPSVEAGLALSSTKLLIK